VETGTESSTSEPAFHADDADEVAEYRNVSALAIVGLVFGLMSPLCFASPLFMAIPLFGVAISVLALRRIAASDGALVGRWAAIAGLVLAVLSASAAISREQIISTIRTRQAAALGRDWLELLLQGDTEKAFRLTVAGNRRSPQPPEPMAPAPTKTPYDEFLEHPIIPQLAAAGANSQVRYLETLSFEPQARRQFLITQRFVVTPDQTAADGHAHPIEVSLTLQRSQLATERQSRWLVANYNSPQSAAEADHVH
jgi:hypothetical protein